MKNFIAFHLMSLIMLETSLAKCPDGYADLGTGCYYFSNDSNSLTWQQASFTCSTQPKRHLVEIGSQQEQDKLRNYIKTTADPTGRYGYWIGATDLAKEGEFRWTTSGNLLNFTQWTILEPDNFNGNENCVALVRAFNYEWVDLRCDVSPQDALPLRAICETDLI